MTAENVKAMPAQPAPSLLSNQTRLAEICERDILAQDNDILISRAEVADIEAALKTAINKLGTEIAERNTTQRKLNSARAAIRELVKEGD